jgi:adenylate cyclase
VRGPPGHAGVHYGRLIERDGDVFGRTVNLASRIADLAPSGALYVTVAVVEAIAALDLSIEPVGPADLHGIGAVELYRVGTASPTG